MAIAIFIRYNDINCDNHTRALPSTENPILETVQIGAKVLYHGPDVSVQPGLGDALVKVG